MHLNVRKTRQVDWDKVNRVAPLVEQALGSKRKEVAVVASARRLEKFYPHLVRWDVTRSNSGINTRNVVELFRLSQVVLEAKNMLHVEQSSLLAGDVSDLKRQLAACAEKLQACEQELGEARTQISASAAMIDEYEKRLLAKDKEIEEAQALAHQAPEGGGQESGAEVSGGAKLAETQEQLAAAKRELEQLHEQQAARNRALTAELLEQQQLATKKSEELEMKVKEMAEQRVVFERSQSAQQVATHKQTHASTQHMTRIVHKILHIHM